ncbi:hypothetical protein [Pseudoalteromonas rubra]|nr:hypothetical protein [Pseudoalteromonas rubra]MEC4090303.1 hypothetical protein [Pseudoalteromonas rubra]
MSRKSITGEINSSKNSATQPEAEAGTQVISFMATVSAHIAQAAFDS